MNSYHSPRSFRTFSLSTSVILFLLFFGTRAVWAYQLPENWQPFSAEPKALLKSFAEIPKEKRADVIVIAESEKFTVARDGRAKTVTYLLFRVDTTKGAEGWGSFQVEYSPWYQAPPKVRARVITPDGVQHDLDPKTLKDHAVSDDSPNVYSDQHSYDGPLPAVGVGAIVEEEFTIEDSHPFFENTWSESVSVGRGGGAPVLQTRVQVELPKGMPLHYTTQLLPSLRMSTTDSAETKIYNFENGRTEPASSKPMLPPELPRYPAIFLSTASSWQELAQSYQKRIESQIRPNEVASLVAGLKATDDQTVATVLSKLHKAVRYTGVEFGEANLVPNPPSEVLKRKYGDCKDKAALMVSMLRALGLRANVALLRSGVDHDVDPNFPGMSWFDHAIVYLPDKDMFIDATAEYSRVSELPSEDQDRFALIISDETTGLKRIPQLPSSANRTVETREFTLAPFGPAKVVETSEWYGDQESYYRSDYDGSESKDLKKNLDSYAKSTYLADAVAKYEHGDVSDFKKHFWLRLEVEKAKRASTYLDDAIAAIRVADMVSSQVPEALRTSENEQQRDAQEGGDSNKVRTDDWYLAEIYQTEWRYKIVPPAGYRVRGLPENKTINFGPAVLVERFHANSDNVVEATLSFDLVKRRYTVGEVTALRDALKQFESNGVLSIHFDLSAGTLLKQGKARESLQEYRALITARPKDAIAHARLALGYLNMSLGELARAEAREAVRIDPSSAVVYSTLGDVLQYDVVGRRYQYGFDLQGAIAAYTKAKQLDPKDPSYALSLGELFEYDEDGQRYVGSKKLEDAIAIYRELKKNEDANTDTANEHLLYALAYARKYTDLEQLATDLGNDKQLYMGMRLIATAGLHGGAAAVEQSQAITTDEKARSNALSVAANVMLRMRMYPQAAELFAAAANGQANASAMANLAQVLRNTKPIEIAKLDDSDPSTVVLKAYIYGADLHKSNEVLGLLSRAVRELPGDYAKDVVKHEWTIRFKTELPQQVLADITFGMMKTSREGDDTTGYRISFLTPGAQTQHVYVVKEDGAYKMLAEAGDLVPLGQEVLDRIGRNELSSAKVLLDWARDDRKLLSGEDPFAGNAFPRIWNKTKEADANLMRAAAVTLVSSAPNAARPYIPDVEASRQKAQNEAERNSYTEALIVAYDNVDDYARMKDMASELFHKYPQSANLFRLLATSLIEQKKWDEAANLVEKSKGKLSDETTAAMVQARAYLAQRKPEPAVDVLKALIDSGKADEQAINEYGWAMVMANNVRPEGLTTVQQTAQVPKNQTYAIVHTLACMYAVAGQFPQAQQNLLQTIRLDSTPDELNSNIWFGYGLLAESIGENKAAIGFYRKVEKPRFTEGMEQSTYMLAQRRLEVIDHK